MIKQKEISLPDQGRGYHLITRYIEQELGELPEKGLVHLLLKHTSAALTLNENADPSVRVDFESFMNRLVPEDSDYFIHTMEGRDDMPAHLKSSILGQQISIPVSSHQLNLGTWQGIFLCEFRNRPGRRRLLMTVYS